MLATEKPIPGLHQLVFVFSDDHFDSSEFLGVESLRPRQCNTAEPEFCHAAVTSNVNMGWFSYFVGVEEEPVWSNDLDRR